MFRNAAIAVCLFALAVPAMAANPKGSLAINPIDLNYRFSRLKNEAPRREAADPEIILYKDRYYLFASKSGGYWSSENLADWTYIPTTSFPTENYAPTVAVIGDDLVFFVSGHDHFYKTQDPDSGVWEKIPTKYPRRDTDPALFVDDDKRVYIYWGCHPEDPIMGVEIDPADGFAMIGEPKVLIGHGFAKYGWEKHGKNNENERSGWNEGANMLKYKGKYYLQYAGPGTENRIYADGYYVGASPLGPFKYMDNSPFSIKPGGFIGSAGHGGTFKDKLGNYWHVASMLVGVHHGFERRLGLFPVFFDKNDKMYAITEMTDRPFYIPSKKMNFAKDSLESGQQLLSYAKKADATSQNEGFPASNAADEQIETWWAAASGKKGERLTIDLGKSCDISSVHVNFADEGFNIYADDEPPVYRYTIKVSEDAKNWKMFADKSKNERNAPHELLNVPNPIKARYVSIENAQDLNGGLFSISGLRVFGKSDTPVPSKPKTFEAARDANDRRNIELSWEPVENAEGYILRWGVEPDKLFSARTMRETSLKGSFLNVDNAYYFSIEPLNMGGSGKAIKTATE